MASPCRNCSAGNCCKSKPKNDNTSVALPRRSTRATDAQPVWSVQDGTSDARQRQLQGLMSREEPLDSKCGAGQTGQCCKDLKGEDERKLISPEIVRDVIIGLSDGLTVPFALTAGLSSLGSSKLVVTGGLAELCAGAISMGVGGFLASQAELDHFHYLRRQTQARVMRSCAGEMEREVHSILGPLGVNETISRLLAEDLRQVEDGFLGERVDGAEGITLGNESAPLLPGAKKSNGWRPWRQEADQEEGGEKGSEEMGLTAFLLKFGEGMEEVPQSRLYISALTIGLSYFIGGLIPLIPYMVTSDAAAGLIFSCIITGIILLIFGGFKTYFTGGQGGFGGYAWGAFSTMVVGGVAAGAAYGLVKVMGVQE